MFPLVDVEHIDILTVTWNFIKILQWCFSAYSEMNVHNVGKAIHKWEITHTNHVTIK